MPSPTLLEILDELANKIRVAITDPEDLQVEPRRNFNPTPPSIDIYPGDPFRDTTAAGFGDVAGQVFFTVRARVNAADHDEAQNLLITLMDEESDIGIATLLMDDQTLNGKASSVDVNGPSGYTLYEDIPGKGSWFGCEWRVTVLRALS